MSGTIECNGLVLAGGRSARMGRDKATLEIKGRPLWQRQCDVLMSAGARNVLFSVREDQAWPLSESQLVRDTVTDAGPLAGLLAGLERTDVSHLAVLAVDLPRMNATWFASLISECASKAGAVGKRGDFFEPLAAIYPRELLPLAQTALARRALSLQHLLATACAQGLMRVREISAAEEPWFTNWNTPADAEPKA